MGALADYLNSISDVSTLDIEGAPPLAEMDDATPADIAGFGIQAMELAWESVSGDVRREAVKALRAITEESLKDLDWGEAMGVVGDVPILGWIIKLAAMVGIANAKMIKLFGNDSEDVTRGYSQYYTIDGARPTNVDGNPPYIAVNNPEWKDLNQDPGKWTGMHKIFGYANYKPRGVSPRYSFEPCLRPMTTEGVPLGLARMSPGGRWQRNNGIPIRCGAYGPTGFTKWMGCHPAAITKRGKRKIRKKVFKKCFTVVVPIWHPFSIPVQGSNLLPVAPALSGGVAWNPNELLISRQAQILTYPAVNMLANLDLPARMASHLVQWIASNVNNQRELRFQRMSKGKLSGFPGINILDASKKSKWAGAMFYMSETGSIVGYPEHLDQPNPRDWGFSYDGGTPMSLADVNTVVGTTLAALTTRAAVLRNQSLCAALVGQGIADKLKGRDEKLRAALLEAAEPRSVKPKRGKGTLPPRLPSPSHKGTPRDSLSRVQVRPGVSPRGLRTGRVPPPESDFPWAKAVAGGAVAVAGAGAVLYKTLNR